MFRPDCVRRCSFRRRGLHAPLFASWLPTRVLLRYVRVPSYVRRRCSLRFRCSMRCPGPRWVLRACLLAALCARHARFGQLPLAAAFSFPSAASLLPSASPRSTPVSALCIFHAIRHLLPHIPPSSLPSLLPPLTPIHKYSIKAKEGADAPGHSAPPTPLFHPGDAL